MGARHRDRTPDLGCRFQWQVGGHGDWLASWSTCVAGLTTAGVPYDSQPGKEQIPMGMVKVTIV